MTPDDPHFAPYLAAMRRHAQHPLVLETTVADMLVLVSTLQLALRHPAMPRRVKGQVERFLEATCAALAGLEPVLGEVARLGNDPQYDVPAEAAP
jgi:hypothetical protein